MLRYGQLADIVQQRRGAQRLQFLLRQVELARQLHGVNAHALQMIVRGLVLGFNGQSQRFNGAHVQRRHLRHMVLFIFQFAQVEPVRAIDNEHRRQRQQCGLPARAPVDPSEERGHRPARQVIWQRPEIAVRPDLLQVLVLGERDDGRHRQGIEQEIDGGGEHQQQRGVGVQRSVISEVSRWKH